MRTVKLLLFSLNILFGINVTAQEVPDDFPDINTKITGETGEGKVFLTVSRDTEGLGYYIMILENDGTPYFYRKLPYNYSYDFKRQPNAYYSYMEYVYPPQDYKAIAKVLDPEFKLVDSCLMTEGFISDSHDFLILPNGHYFLFTHEPYPYNLEEYGGYPNATPLGTVIQEFDAEKNLVWQWRYYDHFNIESTPIRRLGRLEPDLIHTNSIELDMDGNLLVSSINAEFAFKINRQTGDVVWVLGGKNNMFSFIGVDSIKATGWFDGHSLRRLPNGNILYFDNGDRRTDEISHVCEWKLDEENMTAELVWEYIPDPPVYGPTRGNSNRLPNGNTFIGWGSASDEGGPVCSEVNPEGEVVFELSWNNPGLSSYRAFRMPVTNGPAAAMTAYEIRDKETIDFIQDDTIHTGVTVKIESLSPYDYNEMEILSYDFAPYKPVFPGPDPLAYPKRVVMKTKYINEIKGEILFDVEKFGIRNPEQVKIYFRPFEGQGLFLPINNIYDPAKNALIASFNKAGEFIFTWPDHEHILFRPLAYQPKHDKRLNEKDNIIFKWAPSGFFTGFDFQLSDDESFSSLLINEKNLGIPYYKSEKLAAGKYFWRIRSINETGISEWSETSEFSTEMDFIDVTSPNGSEKWVMGEDYFITWEDNVDEEVILSLYQDTQFIGVIDTVESHGAYSWTAPVDLDPADNYFIEVKSIVNSSTSGKNTTGFSLSTDYTSIPLLNKVEGIRIFPMPAGEKLNVEFEIAENTIISMGIYDLHGRKIREVYKGTADAGKNSFSLNITDISAGIYLLRIDNTSGNYCTSLLISK